MDRPKRIFGKPPVVDDTLDDSSFAEMDNTLTNKVNPFKKPRVISQQDFSINFHDSNIDSSLERSATASKPKQIFQQKQLPLDPFNMFQNEDDTTSTQSQRNGMTDISSTQTSPFLGKKTNPFKKSIVPQAGAFDVDFEQTKTNVVESATPNKIATKTNQKRKGSGQTSFTDTMSQPSGNDTTCKDESVTQVKKTKKASLFRKTGEKIKDVFDVEFNESTFSDDLEEEVEVSSVFKKANGSVTNFDVTYGVTTTTVTTKTFNETRKNKSTLLDSVTVEKVGLEKEDTVTETVEANEEENVQLVEGDDDNDNDNGKDESVEDGDGDEDEEEAEEETLKGPEGHIGELTKTRKSVEPQSLLPSDMLQNISHENPTTVEQSQQNGSTKSESFLNESSFNDDNLKHWMSDHSDEEMNLPTVPDIQTRLSNVKNLSARKSVTREMPRTRDTPPQATKKTPLRETSNILSWEDKFNQIVSKAGKKSEIPKDAENKKSVKKVFTGKPSQQETKKPSQPIKPINTNINNNNKIPAKIRKPAAFATKRLYQYIIEKIRPKFGIDSVIKAEQLILSICDTVKAVTRRKTHQKKIIFDLKKEMALAGVIETTVDFYEFVIKFLPYNFRIKVVPCLQPTTNTIHPPRDSMNPFDKLI